MPKPDYADDFIQDPEPGATADQNRVFEDLVARTVNDLRYATQANVELTIKKTTTSKDFTQTYGSHNAFKFSKEVRARLEKLRNRP